MSQSLQLHKRGELGGPVTHVDVIGEIPQTHIFSDDFVKREVAAGWLEFTGEPLVYEVYPDPLGEFAGIGVLTRTLEGDHLTMHVRVDGEDTDVVYKITHPPVLRGFRMDDDREPDGLRIAREYGLELEG